MAQQTIDIGSAPNDGTGDPIRDAFDKCNDNFTELYGSLAGLLDFQGATDCSANPNYPAASQGDIYIVSVAGKIGGASGKVVEVGDFYLALADNAGGTEASVGTSWAVLQANITGGSVISELDDIPDVNAPTPANGDVLTWDSTPGEWVPAAPTGGANALDDLTDVDAPTPSDGDVLTFDSGSGDWVPAAPSGGGGAVLGPWEEITFNSTPVSIFGGRSLYESDQSFSFADRHSIIIESLIYRSMTTNAELYFGSSGAGAYYTAIQGDSNWVNYRLSSGGTANTLASNTADNSWEHDSAIELVLGVAKRTGTTNQIWAALQRMRQPTTANHEDSNINIGGTMKIYIATDNLAKCYVRARHVS